MLWVIYTLAVFLFSVSFFLIKVLPSCKKIIKIAFQAIEVIANHLLDDYKKQKKIQELALSMLGIFLILMLKISLVVLSTLLPFYAAEHFSVVSLEESAQFAVRVDVLMVTTVVALGVYFFWKKTPSKNIDAQGLSHGETEFSDIERAIHNIYFGSPGLQRTLCALESKIFSKRWAQVKAENPIFITSLARSGTTILLESLNTFPKLSSHGYRDMPFIFSPVLWSFLSSSFQRKSDKKERAHGDGLMIDEDSPEAFEEVLWFKFFPQKYSSNRIHLWKKADNKFLEFFHDHIKRIISLRSPNNLSCGRYLSKNNANISRIPVLLEMFPDASVVVPLRNPFEHAASLFRQHENFQRKHSDESFTKKYMADIGHFEFGELHRPIDFPQFDELTKGLSPGQIDYWLANWVATYSYLKSLKGITIISYEALCSDSEKTLSNLCQELDIIASVDEINTASRLLKETPSRRGYHKFSESLSIKAEELYKLLLARVV